MCECILFFHSDGSIYLLCCFSFTHAHAAFRSCFAYSIYIHIQRRTHSKHSLLSLTTTLSIKLLLFFFALTRSPYGTNTSFDRLAYRIKNHWMFSPPPAQTPLVWKSSWICGTHTKKKVTSCNNEQLTWVRVSVQIERTRRGWEEEEEVKCEWEKKMTTEKKERIALAFDRAQIILNSCCCFCCQWKCLSFSFELEFQLGCSFFRVCERVFFAVVFGLLFLFRWF